MKILDGKPKTIVVNGYSTSFHWPKILQRKLDRHLGGRVITVVSATKGGTPIAKWMDADTGQPESQWSRLRQAVHGDRGSPVVVLCQQSLQWVYGSREAGIRGESDRERIVRGADVLERYVRAILADDGVHPNNMGAEVMAQLWFETLCRHDGVEVPGWSTEEMRRAVSSPDSSPENRRRGRRR